MSEAQYVSTGQISGKDGLSHYGLGLQKYTHFTSPIRRYADVIVHKQLLANTAVYPNDRMGSSRNPRSATFALDTLPASKVISILSGEGLHGTEPDDRLSAQPQDKDLAIITPTMTSEEDEVDEPSVTTVSLYEPSQVSKICDGLNRQNRMSKLSSFECQNLFLSLYFKDHVETTQAVVTNLRSNGFWVYVPRFDMRGAVFLSDIKGNVQVDPALFKLPDSAGQEPSAGFVSSGRARMFPSGKCQLFESPQARLEVVVPESNAPLQIHILDVVTVKILSDNWDTRSRVPPPRLHLVAAGSTKSPPQRKMGSATLVNKTVDRIQSTSSVNKALENIHSVSLYQQILQIETPPLLVDVPLRSGTDRSPTDAVKGLATIPGRIIFGAFQNPDTHSAKQEASIADAAEAAKERRTQLLDAQARNNEFNKSKQIEKDATARMQRLAANKRNARRAKAK